MSTGDVENIYTSEFAKSWSAWGFRLRKRLGVWVRRIRRAYGTCVLAGSA